MSSNLFKAEIGFGIDQENGGSLAYILSGTAAPDGTSGKQSEAPIGSLYLRSGTAEIYKKVANAGAAADYEEIIGNVDLNELAWRSEKVRFVTNDTLAAGSVDITALTDNDDMVYGDISVGEYCIGDIDGSPALFEITATPGTPNITIAAADQSISNNDTFVVQQYLPDPTGQENAAIVHIPLAGSAAIKISDFDWALATGITLSNTYTAASGDVASGDTVEQALQKLDGNNDAQDSVLGTSQGDTNLGAFAAVGNIFLGATLTVKAALQKLADVLGGLRGTQTTGVTTATVVDSVPHASVTCVKWLVEVFETATPAKREAFEIFALTDGTTVDDSGKYAKVKIGNVVGLTETIAINGANLELSIAATNSCTVNVRRIEVVKDVL